MKTKIILSCLLLIMSSGVFADDITNGKSIFTSRCATCHKLGSVLVGPDLVDVDKRRSINWIINFVHSSTTVIKSGDKDANTLFEKFNKIQMPEQPDLKDSEIKDVVTYIQSAKQNIPKGDDAPFATPTVQKKNYRPVSFHDAGFIIAYLSLVTTLICVLYFAVAVKSIK